MGSQIASLTAAQQKALLSQLQQNSFYPESYRINRLMTNILFPTADTAGGGHYLRLTWTPKQTVGIAAISGNLFQIYASTIYKIAVLVSYANTITLGDNTTSTIPDDEGNIIYRGAMVTEVFNLYQNMYPGVYILEANKPLYIYFWIEDAGLASGNTVIGNVILHTIQTGLKS